MCVYLLSQRTQASRRGDSEMTALPPPRVSLRFGTHTASRRREMAALILPADRALAHRLLLGWMIQGDASSSVGLIAQIATIET